MYSVFPSGPAMVIFLVSSFLLLREQRGGWDKTGVS